MNRARSLILVMIIFVVSSFISYLPTSVATADHVAVSQLEFATGTCSSYEYRVIDGNSYFGANSNRISYVGGTIVDAAAYPELGIDFETAADLYLEIEQNWRNIDFLGITAICDTGTSFVWAAGEPLVYIGNNTFIGGSSGLASPFCSGSILRAVAPGGNLDELTIDLLGADSDCTDEIFFPADSANNGQFNRDDHDIVTLSSDSLRNTAEVAQPLLSSDGLLQAVTGGGPVDPGGPGDPGGADDPLTATFRSIRRISLNTQYGTEFYEMFDWGGSGSNYERYWLINSPDETRNSVVYGQVSDSQRAQCTPYIQVENLDIAFEGGTSFNDYSEDLENDFQRIQDGNSDIRYHDVNSISGSGSSFVCVRAADSIDIENISSGGNARLFFEYFGGSDTVRTLLKSGGGNEEPFYTADYQRITAGILAGRNAFGFNYEGEGGTDCYTYVIFDSNPANADQGDVIVGEFYIRRIDGLSCEPTSANDVATIRVISRGSADAPEIQDPSVVGQVEPPDPTCESNIAAIGWILCPFTEFLVDSLESMVQGGIVNSILNFSALDPDVDDGNQRDALFDIWVGFRTIANLGFVIAFFVVIYSAASGGLLSAYDTKKMLPRIFIGAIGVQLSFYICTFLVDVFNDLGGGIADIMLAPIGGEGVGAVFDGVPTIPFAGLFSASLEVAAAALFLLLTLIIVLFAIGGLLLMIVVFILRNMALMVLIAISPLAFVAWILPNTENLARKWWNFTIQLLAIYPIAIMFLSAGRLVSHIWSSGSGNYLNNLIGLLALFAPYVLAPKLFSFAGQAIGGIVRGVEGARDRSKGRVQKLRGTDMGKRLETNARKNAADRVNARYGVNGTAAGGFIGRNVVQSKAGERILARTQARHDALRSEDEKAAEILLEERISGKDNDTRRDMVRDAASSESATMESRMAAMNRMLIDKDYDGLERAMIDMAKSGDAGKAQIDRFKKLNAGELSTRATHLVAADVDQLAAADTPGGQYGNVTGAQSLAGGNFDKIQTQNAASVRSSVATLREHATSAAPAAERQKSLAAMQSLVDNYDRLDDQAQSRMDAGTRDAIELARMEVNRINGVAGPPSPTTSAAAGRADAKLNSGDRANLNLPT